MSYQLFGKVSRFGSWIAIPVGLFSSLLTFGVLFFLQVPLVNLFVLPSITGILVGLVCYSLIQFSVTRRLELIYEVHEEILSRRFDELSLSGIKNNDELDRLIHHAIRMSDSVEREINRLKKIENYRKEFIGDVSHELKTPIFAIQGFIETLLNGALEDEEVNRRFLEKAMRNVNRLILLTQDLMEISKLETGELKSTMQIHELAPLVSEVVESLQYKAQKEQVSLSIDPIDPKLNIVGDRNQIRQVLNNLVENSLKYNRPEGRVFIGVRTFPKDESKIEVLVKDTGLGIERKYLSRVTERFYRIDKSRSRDKGGTGLGLSIVKHILEAHGESLNISSTPGVGSTFSFTLLNAAFYKG